MHTLGSAFMESGLYGGAIQRVRYNDSRRYSKIFRGL